MKMEPKGFFKLRIVKDTLIINTKEFDLSTAKAGSVEELKQNYKTFLFELDSIIKITIHGLSPNMTFKHEYIQLSEEDKDIHELTFLVIHDDLYGRHLRSILELIAPRHIKCSNNNDLVHSCLDMSLSSGSAHNIQSSRPYRGTSGPYRGTSGPYRGTSGLSSSDEGYEPYTICLPNQFEAFDMQNRLIPTDVMLTKLEDNKTFDVRKSSCLLVVGKSFDEEFKNPIKILGLTQIKLQSK